MNYSLLRSRTFWTLVILVAFDVLQVYGNVMPPAFASLVNLALGTVASYFHLQTGNSVAGSKLGRLTPEIH